MPKQGHSQSADVLIYVSMADIKAIAEALMNISSQEVDELAKVLKDEYGIEPEKQEKLKIPFISRMQKIKSISKRKRSK